MAILRPPHDLVYRLVTRASAPLATIDKDDQGGLIAILTAFSLTLVLMSVGIRFYAKKEWRAYKSDDFAFFAAVVSVATVPGCLSHSRHGVDVFNCSNSPCHCTTETGSWKIDSQASECGT